ncbi:hypothetical protein ACXY7D_11990 [Sphingomonas melonis]
MTTPATILASMTGADNVKIIYCHTPNRSSVTASFTITKNIPCACCPTMRQVIQPISVSANTARSDDEAAIFEAVRFALAAKVRKIVKRYEVKS